MVSGTSGCENMGRVGRRNWVERCKCSVLIYEILKLIFKQKTRLIDKLFLCLTLIEFLKMNIR